MKVKQFKAKTQRRKDVKRIVVLVFFALIIFCSCASPSYWSVQHLQTGSPLFDGAKLTYHPPEKTRGMKLEFYKTPDSLKLFIVAEEHRITVKGQEVTVVALFQKEKKEFTCPLFQGGQRLLASIEMQSALLKALENGETVTLKCSGYVTTIYPEHFKQNFAKLHVQPLILPIEFILRPA